MRIRLWSGSKAHLNKFNSCHAFYILLVAVLTVGLSAEVSPAVSVLPSNQQVLDFLTESIDWYRQCAIERQMATDPVDLVFLEDNRRITGQIVQLSFDFARADASVVTPLADNQKGNSIASSSSSDLAQSVQLENGAELALRQASQQVQDTKKKLLTSRGNERRRLQAVLDATQSRVVVLQAASATLRQLVESARFGGRENGDLLSKIDDLGRTVPDIANQTAGGPQAQRSSLPSMARPTNSGILSLSSQVSAYEQKLRILNDEILRTDNLRQTSDGLRIPLLASVKKRFSIDTANDLLTSDLSALQQQKDRIDELTALFNAISPGIVALDKQRVLLFAYTSQLKSWRAAIVSEDEKTWKYLMFRLVGVAVVIAALVIIGAATRRAIRQHVHNPDRRHVMLVIQRIVLWFTIVLVTAFAFASDLTSLATFFGLLTAGVAVALQSVILSTLGYFILVGRHGIELGDRVQISGVTGDVIDIGWLQFQLREIDNKTQQATGHIVTFSNSFVLASPATGLCKFNHKDLQRAQLQAVPCAGN